MQFFFDEFKWTARYINMNSNQKYSDLDYNWFCIVKVGEWSVKIDPFECKIVDGALLLLNALTIIIT